MLKQAPETKIIAFGGEYMKRAGAEIKIELTKLVTRWRRDADQYQRQVEESRAKNLPHDQMISMMTCLRLCARELESSLARPANEAANKK